MKTVILSSFLIASFLICTALADQMNDQDINIRYSGNTASISVKNNLALNTLHVECIGPSGRVVLNVPRSSWSVWTDYMKIPFTVSATGEGHCWTYEVGR